jgi:hypothetical protein
MPLKAVASICAIDPDCVKHIRALTQTGKRGRPSVKVNGRDVLKVLEKHGAVTAKAMFLEAASSI